MNAALLISEVQNEAKDKGEFLSLVTLDAAKAFDVVWQASLLRKIYHEGVNGTLWLTLSRMYSDAVTSVKWGPLISSSFPIKQGVRQGGILSTTHYKLFNNGLLHMLDESGLGARIGCFTCGAPTCADDVAVLGNEVLHVLCMVEIVRGYCCLERYTIHPQKSEEVVMNCERDSRSGVVIKYGNESIRKSISTVHLGVERSKTGRPDVGKKIQLGRRTMYSLMGAGVYGGSGLNPMVSAHLWRIYPLPRILYGLEVQTCLQSDILAMEQLQRSMLRRIQSLPNSTAIPALYCLLGIRPLEQELDLRRLSLLANVLYADGTLEQDIAIRQISVKDSNSCSWFILCNKLLHKYNLPNIYIVRKKFESESLFKKQVKSSVDKFIKESGLTVAEGRRSLCYLNVDGCDVGKVHPCWNTVDNTVMDVKRAFVKARILTGTYYLQADRDKFRRSGTMSQCPLCSATSEDRLHFLIACVPLNQVRQSYITEIEKRLLQQNTAQCVTAALNDANFLAQLIIDCTSKVICDRLLLVDSDFHEIETVSRKLCFALHLKRCRLLKQLG